MLWSAVVIVLLIVLLIRTMMAVASQMNASASKYAHERRTRYVAGLFTNNFIDSSVLFVTRFKTLPSVSAITQIDVTKAYAFITEKLKDQITCLYQANMFDHNEGKTYFNMSIIELKNKRIIELGTGYVEVIYTNAYYDWVQVLLSELAMFRIETKAVEEKAPIIVGFARAMEMN